jgi:alpha-beta hydrolase superfamily lysophospholipase
MTQQSKIPVPLQDEPAEAKGSLIERVVRNYDLVKLAPAPIPEELIPPAAKRRRYRRADEVAEVDEVAPVAARAPAPAPVAEARPEVVMGPGSWRWVERAYASMRWLGQSDVLARVKQPVLLLATDQDALVSYKASARAAARLPHCELVNFGERARHEILREADPVRLEALARIDAFLAAVLVAGATA